VTDLGLKGSDQDISIIPQMVGALCDDFADFLRTHDRGVFWLQAPAHVGKTTLVQGLAGAEMGDEPIDPRFAGGDGGKLVAYYCRREYRPELASMINTLQDKLQAAYDASQIIRNEQPDARSVLVAGTPKGTRDQATRLATQVPTMKGMSGAERSRDATKRGQHSRF
jgi:hypothetical protein